MSTRATIVQHQSSPPFMGLLEDFFKTHVVELLQDILRATVAKLLL